MLSRCTFLPWLWVSRRETPIAPQTKSVRSADTRRSLGHAIFSHFRRRHRLRQEGREQVRRLCPERHDPRKEGGDLGITPRQQSRLIGQRPDLVAAFVRGLAGFFAQSRFTLGERLALFLEGVFARAESSPPVVRLWS